MRAASVKSAGGGCDPAVRLLAQAEVSARRPFCCVCDAAVDDRRLGWAPISPHL